MILLDVGYKEASPKIEGAMALLSTSAGPVLARARVAGESHSDRREPRKSSGSVALVRELVPCESASYNEVRPGAGALVVADPEEWITREGLETFGRLSGDNPLISHYARTGDGRPLPALGRAREPRRPARGL